MHFCQATYGPSCISIFNNLNVKTNGGLKIAKNTLRNSVQYAKKKKKEHTLLLCLHELRKGNKIFRSQHTEWLKSQLTKICLHTFLSFD
jgi:hypothetical protein